MGLVLLIILIILLLGGLRWDWGYGPNGLLVSLLLVLVILMLCGYIPSRF